VRFASSFTATLLNDLLNTLRMFADEIAMSHRPEVRIVFLNTLLELLEAFVEVDSLTGFTRFFLHSGIKSGALTVATAATSLICAVC
jgi:hypothetical protein